MLQVLIGVILFVVVAFAAAPFFQHRRISGVPGAFYLEQKLQAQVIELWREFRVESGLQREQLRNAEELARQAVIFAAFFRKAIDDGYDEELALYLRDFRERRGEAEVFRTIIATLLDHHCADNRLLREQAMLEVLRHQ